MLLELLFFVASGTSVTPATPTAVETATEAAPSEPGAKVDGAALVENLAKACASHPEVERAFVLAQSTPDGSVSYMFVPIFDRTVSNDVLNEAQTAYRALAPSGTSLQIMLLARNQWKKQLSGVPPIYVRPKPVGKS